MFTRFVILTCLAGGCATSQQAGTIAADGLLAISRATRAVVAELPASARTPVVNADLQHFGTALQAAADLVPVSCSATPDAALPVASQAVSDAFAALLRDLAGTPHTGEAWRPRSLDDLHELGVATGRALLKRSRMHTADLSPTDDIAIASAVIGGLSSLIPGALAIYNAVHSPPGPDQCAAAAAALKSEVATLPAALGAGTAAAGSTSP